MTDELKNHLAEIKRRQDAGELPKFPTRAQRLSWTYGQMAADRIMTSEQSESFMDSAEVAVDMEPRCCWCGHADPLGEKIR